MKRLAFAALAIAVVLALCSCTSNVSVATERQDVSTSQSEEDQTQNASTPADIVDTESFDLAVYKEDASNFRVSTYNASVILANMGNYENNYWKALGSLSDNMVDKAFDWLSENSDETRETVEANCESIRAAYKELILTDFGSDKEASEIDAAVRSLYSGYSELYDTILNPSGSRGYFASNVSDLISEIQSANDDLLLFLPEETQ